MRKLFLAVAVVSMGLFSSCDKCKDKTCENSASCDKKTADCSNVCVNGGTSDASTGSCSCTEFYNSSTCSNEVRNDLAGEYKGNMTLGALGDYGSVAVVSNSGPDATGQKFVITTTIAPGVTSVIEILGNLTSKDSVTLVETVVPFTLLPSENSARVTGTGFYVDGKMDATVYLVTIPTGIKITATYVGRK